MSSCLRASIPCFLLGCFFWQSLLHGMGERLAETVKGPQRHNRNSIPLGWALILIDL